MPSIPQSLLWISLVVLWLFVLVPMLINKRDTVRPTSDVALATRVLNGGAKSRLSKRSGPAAGHRHDPDWQRDESEFTEDAPLDDADDDLDYRAAPVRARARSGAVMLMDPVTERIESDYLDSDYLDVDVVEESSGALPVGSGAQAGLFDAPPAPERQPAAETIPEPGPEAARTDGTDDEYEYIDDTSGLEAEAEPFTPAAPSASRRRRLQATSAAAVSARKYRFRKRVLVTMAALMAVSAALSFTVTPAMWWACGASAAATLLYLGYLRRQTRIEEQVRRRRQQRVARVHAGEEFVAERVMDREFDVVPSRLQRPGVVVLDIDDEDPAFEHLDEVSYSRQRYDFPRASGQ